MLTVRLLAHRGLWAAEAGGAGAPNSPTAVRAALEAGHGVETDLRDRAGALVVAHDPGDASAWPAETLAALVRDHGAPGAPLALNIKADGLAPLVADAFGDVPGWFAFDMSAPETLRWARAGLPWFRRESELEPNPSPDLSATGGQDALGTPREASGVWVDAFTGDWYPPDLLRAHRRAGRQVCVVSPELHGRDPRPLIDLLAADGAREDLDIWVCADRLDLWTRWWVG